MITRYSEFELFEAISTELEYNSQSFAREYYHPNQNKTWDICLLSYPRTVIELKIGASENEVSKSCNNLISTLDSRDILIMINVVSKNNIEWNQCDYGGDDIPTLRLETPFPSTIVIYTNAPDYFWEDDDEEYIAKLGYYGSDHETGDLHDWGEIVCSMIDRIRLESQNPEYISTKDISTSSYEFSLDLLNKNLPTVDDELVEEIRKNGITEPIILVQRGADLELCDGYKRLEASIKLGFETIPAVISNRAVDSWWDEDYEIRDKLRTPLMEISNLISDVNARSLIQYEFKQICQEYEEKHYTSCGLRVGRLLESLIYGLSKTWDVPLDQPRLETLNKIEETTNEIKSTFLDYTDSNLTEAEKERKLKIIQDKTLKIHGYVSNFHLDIVKSGEDMFHSSKIPRNTGAILRDIKRKYSQIKYVREQFEGNSLESLNAEILKFRNEAAHASNKLEIRELQEEEALEMLDKLGRLIYKFVNIGHSIEHQKVESSKKNKN